MERSTEILMAPEYDILEKAALDFDGVLGRVDASMERLYNTAEYFGIDPEPIRIARKTKENDGGGSFDPLIFIEKQLPEDAMPAFEKHFISAQGPQILFDDAARLLKKLDDNAYPHYVLTRGVRPDSRWQKMKVKASGYQGEIILTQDPYKGKDTEGDYLIENNEHAWKGAPQNSKGFLILRNGTQNPLTMLPPGIKLIRSLDELQIVNRRLIKAMPTLSTAK